MAATQIRRELALFLGIDVVIGVQTVHERTAGNLLPTCCPTLAAVREDAKICAKNNAEHYSG